MPTIAPSEDVLGYAVAAYLIVIGSLVAYGLWVQAQRRALRRSAEERLDSGEAGEP